MEITMFAVESSNLKNVGYDRESRTLAIQFKTGTATYLYSEFPAEKYDELLAAASKGKFFKDEIKGKFECRKQADEALT